MAGHATKILDRFPSFMRADGPGKSIGSVATALGTQLDEAERLTNAIQRGHRIAVAEEELDVLRLAALLGLQRADFFILRTFYENGFFALTEKDVAVTFAGGKTGFDFVLKIVTSAALNSIQTEIQSKLQTLVTPPRAGVSARDIVTTLGRSTLYRLRGVSLVAARSGDGSLLDTASVVLGDPADPQDREQRAYSAYVDKLREAVERVAEILFDGCGTIHALLEGASVLLDAETTGPITHPDAGQPRGGFIHQLPIRYTIPQDGQPVEQDGAVFMVENPLIDKTTDDLPRKQREGFRITRKAFFTEPVSVQITGLGNRTVLPRMVNETTHEGVGFRKAIQDKQILLFSADSRVYLDGTDVTGSAYYFKGALFGLSKVDSSQDVDVSPVATPPGSLDRNYPRPAIVPASSLPVITLPLGDIDWRFSVGEGAFDASGFDEAVFAGPDPVPSAKVQLLWKEEKPFSVLILIPAELKPLETSVLGGADLRKLVRAGLERFRTAGIELQVEYFDSKWILGKSVLRTEDAGSGTGVNFEGTVLSGTPGPG